MHSLEIYTVCECVHSLEMCTVLKCMQYSRQNSTDSGGIRLSIKMFA